MPLLLAKEGEANFIKKVTGKEETRLFLEKLGFVTGAAITVVSSLGGNLIVNVKTPASPSTGIWRRELSCKNNQKGWRYQNEDITKRKTGRYGESYKNQW